MLDKRIFMQYTMHHHPVITRKEYLKMKKNLIAFIASLIAVIMTLSSASACTAFYAGSDMTADGKTIFARSEDLSNSYNKMQFVAESGAHKAGEEYAGCYGFTYTFTHDSYGYTAFQDDNMEAKDYVCPDCDSTHPHTPYQAAGTNEMGVSMSATETLYGCSAVIDADPFEDAGIEEAEIPTVILSEAATAKEGVDLLLKIYDEAGCNSGSGIFIADKDEVWYIENTTGHQYVAVKLSSTVVFPEPNMSAIGLIDLDDENVIASPKLIEVAKAAGTYVGDEAANTIDFCASYFQGQGQASRMTQALNYLNGVDTFTNDAGSYDASAYVISNVAADGSICAFYNAIVPTHKLTVADVIGYYHLDTIGKPGNLETHIFQLTPGGDKLYDIVEWVAVDDAAINVFVPYLPMLTTGYDASLQVSTLAANFVTEEPTEGVYFPTTKNMRIDGQRVPVQGFMVLPENWADSFYWSVDAVSNLCMYADVDEALKASVLGGLDDIQTQIYNDFYAKDGALAGLKAIVDSGDIDTAKATATAYSAEIAAAVHDLMVTCALTIIAK